MFQLIVSVIAIALVAILAAASIYYGGSAFTNSNTKGAVAALVNSGEQIAGAAALYRVDNTVAPVDITTLTPASGTTYLSGAPVAPKFASGQWQLNADGSVAYISIATTAASQVCAEVLNQNGNHAQTTAAGTAPAVADIPGVFGCVAVGTNVAFAYKM